MWLKGHTDIGTITILWSQPVTALQMLMPDGQWRYVRHIDNALVSSVSILHSACGVATYVRSGCQLG